MKGKVWLTHIVGAAFAFGMSLAVTGCLVTAFNLTTRGMGKLALACGLFALICSAAFRFRYGHVALLCAMALTAGYLWRDGEFVHHLQSFLCNITSRYHYAYGWPVLGADAAGSADLVVITAGWIAAVSTAWVICRRKSAAFALIPGLLALVCCMVVTDTVPDERYLFAWLLTSALLLLTDWARCRGEQGAKLALLLAVPTAVFLTVLFMMVPQKGYVNQSEEYTRNLLNWVQKIETVVQETGREFSISAGESGTFEQLDLEQVGPRLQLDYPVMKVTSPVSGTLYLRGQDYDSYGGPGWTASRHRAETFSGEGNSLGRLEIKTYGVKSVLYLPYYSAGEVTLVGGKITNTQRLTGYSYELSENAQVQSEPEEALRQLPMETSQWARTLALEITAEAGTRQEMADAIGAYVRSSARYDLDTARMSEDAEDFARWFLEESDTGYCVHFATAAAVLLRGAGIPARYVEGYMVRTEAGEGTVVTGKEAHAWAEYYDGGVWRILEATPAAEETVPVVPMQTQPQVTEPSLPNRPTIPREQEETNLPAAETEAERTPAETPKSLPPWLGRMMAVLLLLSAIPLQAQLRVLRKRKRWYGGDPNTQALARYRQSLQLARIMKQTLPEELEQLAQKAKYSQHVLTPEELAQFDTFRREGLARLRKNSPVRKTVFWVLFALD